MRGELEEGDENEMGWSPGSEAGEEEKDEVNSRGLHRNGSETPGGQNRTEQ